VYGDIGTSPLYALKESLAAATNHAGHSALTHEMVFGVVSLIVWALIIIVTIKYVVLVMSADNNGEGGTLGPVAKFFRARFVRELRSAEPGSTLPEVEMRSSGT